MGTKQDIWRAAARDGLSAASGAGAVRGATPALACALFLASAILALALAVGADATLWSLHTGAFVFFLAVAACRPALPALAEKARRPPPLPAELPRYTVIVPLRDEAAMASQIVGNLGRLNYPPDRLQVLFVVEDDDRATRDALLRANPPAHMRVLVCPPGGPTTKPRACNLALTHALGDIVVIYDAEDQPDRLQLIEAAARFASGGGDLGCLQAPLRIVERADPLRRQFALEYAAQFEVVMPALAALRLPFALGGTSNHFRRRALEDVGGWDAFNVTEDADIGFRLALKGWRLGVLQAPTWEEAPETLEAWMPQRARWLKGYVQTWSVAMRRPFAGGVRRFIALQATLGLSILSSIAHGPLILLVAASGLIALLNLAAPPVLALDATLLIYGWGSAVLVMAAGARRAGFRMTLADAFNVGGYWPTQSLAAGFALHQLVATPFRWDKTPHRPQPLVADPEPWRRHVALDGEAEGWLTTAA